MTYMHFSPTSRSKWDVFAPVKSTKPIATVTRRNHRCSVTLNGALNHEELESLTAFMREKEAATGTA
jgi:hypothetical protein